jgi:hypothetical protein
MTTDNFCFYLQSSLIQTSQTGGQRYSDTSPFSIPWQESLSMAVFAFSVSHMQLYKLSFFTYKFIQAGLVLEIKPRAFTSNYLFA